MVVAMVAKMNVNIKYIKDAGVPDKERLVLKVITDDDIGYYTIFNTVFIEEKVSTEVKNTFWFPDKKVQKGDFIILYTKSGEQSEARNKAGTISHYFYWGLEKPIWGRKDDAVVLLEVKNWDVKKAVS
jgi:hypothetical protein